ncbi:MAG: type 4a pilus biogenesis protein PilO [Actinomycetia bacterium]|nr:type 4a pilus biogenesis protein PilO [Actinomycetes bacterium]
MNRLSAQTQMIVAGVIIVVIAVAGLFLGILPVFDKTRQMDARISALDGQIMTENAVVASRQSAKAQAAQTEVDLIKIANQVPESPELPSLIINLQDTANQAGLVFAQITPQTPAAVLGADGQPLGYSSIQIEVKVEGQWADIIQYVRTLSKYTRGIRVKSVALNGVDATETQERYVGAKLVLEVYTMSVINVNKPAVPSVPATPAADAQPSQ